MQPARYLLGIILLFSSIFSFGQLGGIHDYLDTAYIPKKRMGQQNDFVNHKVNFPAKPRSMWQAGVFIGYPNITGDCVPALRGIKGLESFAGGIGVSARKSVGYVLSVRASLAYFNLLGIDNQRNKNVNNSLKIQNNYLANPGYYFHNYRTRAFLASADGLLSLNNIMFHSVQGKFNVYMLVGLGAMMYNTRLDALGQDDKRYKVEDIKVSGVSKQSIRKQLRKMFDGNYETEADKLGKPLVGDFSLQTCFTSGFGVEYKMGKNWSLGMEYKRVNTRSDYVDGYYRQSGDIQHPTFTSEWDNIGFISVGANMNIGNPKKETPPLWWLNPIEFPYSEVASPRHMKLPAMTLNDADGDGVSDQFDTEPNTPAGCPVDTHGVTKDTDGDGVPDCKDKEILTQQSCFPVDADGKGNCPQPECCKERPVVTTGGVVVQNGDTTTQSAGCTLQSLGKVQFSTGSITINRNSEAFLAGAAAMIRANPACNIRVSGYGAANKFSQQESWDRVNAVIRYLVDKQGIPEARLIFAYGDPNSDLNAVDLTGTAAEGPSFLPAPHPNLKKRK